MREVTGQAIHYPVPQRLLVCQDALRILDPDQQSVRYVLHTWEKYFRDDPDFVALTRRFPDAISRRNLRTLGREAAADLVLVRPLFLATMMWGYGNRGYGAYRTHRMLTDPNAATALPETVALVAQGKLREAYEQCYLRHCGPAFMTKFLYAVGLGTNQDPQPLVLDSRVAQTLASLADEAGFPIADFVRGSPFLQWYPEGYVRYVELINAWARALGCRPDALELWLFDPSCIEGN